MSERQAYIDEGVGETRAVVAVGGAPERLLIERAGTTYPRLGARYIARVVRLERGIGLALLDLGEDGSAALRLKADRPAPHEGALLEVEIAIEPQGGKAAVARALGPGEGPARRQADAPALERRLAAWAPGARPVVGVAARRMADQAEDEAMAIEHRLAGGGSIAIEPTRALTAIDVDLAAHGGGDSKRSARQANLQAIAAVARLLRLKAQGGLVVIDLIGRGHDGQALAHAAQTAFGPDQPGVIVGPITKFGCLELSLPRRLRPLAEILADGSGRLSTETLALRLLRGLEREARADPGGRLIGRASPAVAAAAERLAPQLAQKIGARFRLAADPALAYDGMAVDTL